ncbi:hypothetical protein [Bacteroides sp.]|uniref:hypothetical protein n=1 Tax=Bacteroides sp. TaxID=29523 RepID=UPI002FCA03F8
MSMTTYIRKEGKCIVGTDFGFGNDVAVETVMIKDENGNVTIVSCDVIGKAEDFASEDKKDSYFKKKQK